MVNNSTACVLEMVAPDYEPSKLASVVFVVAFLPILIYGLKWFKDYGYQSQKSSPSKKAGHLEGVPLLFT